MNSTRAFDWMPSFGIETIQTESKRQILTKVEFPPESPWFSGHFPERPVLPGVSLLAIVWALVRQYTTDQRMSCCLTGFHKVRFKRLIDPKSTLAVVVDLPETPTRGLKFEISFEGEMVCTGEMRVALARIPRPDVEKPFGIREFTVGQLHDLAARIGSTLTKREKVIERALVLGEDRQVIAASLLASLCGGPELIFPNSMNEGTLSKVQEVLPFDAVIVDKDRALPSNLTAVCESPGSSGHILPNISRGEEAAWAHLFTGGSTGEPQIWSKTVNNLLGEAYYLAKRFGFSEKDVILATVPPYHIFGLLFSVLVPYVSGARVIPKTAFFPHEILKYLEKDRCTVLVSAPPHYRALRTSRFKDHCLRMAFSSGAPLDLEAEQAFHQNTGVGVTEVFGSTETGGFANRCLANGERVWIPFDVVDCRVVDGLLHVRSPFASPELERDGGGFCETANRAAVSTEGGLELGPRVDSIVKVGGKRVDLVEVEMAISNLQGVRDAYAFGLDVGQGRGCEIIAMVVADLTEEKIRKNLLKILPTEAIPRRIKYVEKIPYTNLGKRDHSKVLNLMSREP